MSVLILAKKISFTDAKADECGSPPQLEFQAKQARLIFRVVRRLPTFGEESEAPGSDGDASAGQQLAGRDVDGESDLLQALTKGSSKR